MIDDIAQLFYNIRMGNELIRLNALASDMQYEPAEDQGCQVLTQRQQGAVNVSNAVMPNGKQIRLLKTLQTSACERNCFYCPFRAGRDFRRVSLRHDEMASAFNTLYRAGIVQGMFLSSGIAGGSIRTQDEIIKTAEILRFKNNFQGYLHLKLMPGADTSQIERTMELADRVSVNLEAPNNSRLGLIAPGKHFFEELLQALEIADNIRRTQLPERAKNHRWPSITTQFVVGAVGENDNELLTTTQKLIQGVHISRVYYSSFRPIAGTPFENRPASPSQRELRLYQASFLLRDYGFDIEELPFDRSGNLPTGVDPKSAWAKAHLSESPVELNQAEKHELLRVPGIGPKGASAIISARKRGRFRQMEDIQRLGVDLKRAVPFILINGKRPPIQLSFKLSG